MKIIKHLLNKYKFIDQYCKMEKKKDVRDKNIPHGEKQIKNLRIAQSLSRFKWFKLLNNSSMCKKGIIINTPT